MDNENLKNDITFDDLIQDREMQMIKAALPYIGTSSQRSMAIIVKFMELQRTMDMFNNNIAAMQMCSVDDEEDSRQLQMLESIRPFCTQQEQSTIDMLINYVQMFSAYGTLFN